MADHDATADRVLTEIRTYLLPCMPSAALEAVVTALERVLARHKQIPAEAPGVTLCEACWTPYPCDERMELNRVFVAAEFRAGVRAGALAFQDDRPLGSPAQAALREVQRRLRDPEQPDVQAECALVAGTLAGILHIHPEHSWTHRFAAESLAILTPTS